MSADTRDRSVLDELQAMEPGTTTVIRGRAVTRITIDPHDYAIEGVSWDCPAIVAAELLSYMTIAEAVTLATSLRARSGAVRLHAEVRGRGGAARVYFCGGLAGEYSVSVGFCTRAMVLAHWASYCRAHGIEDSGVAS